MQSYCGVSPWIRGWGGVVGEARTVIKALLAAHRYPSPDQPESCGPGHQHPRTHIALCYWDSAPRVEGGWGDADAGGDLGFYSNQQLLHRMFPILHCPHFPLPSPLCIFNCSSVFFFLSLSLCLSLCLFFSRHSVLLPLKQRQATAQRCTV